MHRIPSRKGTFRAVGVLVLLILGSGHLAGADEPDQARRLRKIVTIEQPPGDVVDAAPALPSLAECDRAVRTIAAAYGSYDIDRYLDDAFPNRSEFLDAMLRAELRATSIELFIESVENVRYLPWRQLDSTDDGDRITHTIGADCVADVRVRLVFDSADAGERTVSEVQRGEWRVRFSRRLTEAKEGS